MPELVAIGEKLGFAAVLAPLGLGVLLAVAVFLAQSVTEWFNDRNP